MLPVEFRYKLLKIPRQQQAVPLSAIKVTKASPPRKTFDLRQKIINSARNAAWGFGAEIRLHLIADHLFHSFTSNRKLRTRQSRKVFHARERCVNNCGGVHESIREMKKFPTKVVNLMRFDWIEKRRPKTFYSSSSLMRKYEAFKINIRIAKA